MKIIRICSIVLIAAVLVSINTSCNATKKSNETAIAQTKMNKKNLKGTWILSEMRFVGEKGLYKANLFGIADSPCYKGGEWMFIPNNGTGRFSIKGSERCEEGTHRILWSFNDNGNGTGQIEFKMVDDKNKPLSGNLDGYSILVETLTSEQTVLRVQTDYDGQPFDIVMTLDKISKDVTL